MARVFRHRYADGHTSPKWYIEYRDANGRKRRIAGFVDRRATEQEAARLEREAEQIRSGLLPAQAPQLARGITLHIEEYRDYLTTGGACDAHVNTVYTRLLRVADGCGWLLLSDMNAEQARAWLNTRGNGRPGGRMLAAQTVAHYLTQLCAFGAWCVPARLAVNPFRGVEKPQASTDRRHVRRVLTPPEFRRFIDAARSGRSFAGIDGEGRAALYLVAAYTGLRMSECLSLRREDVTLAGSPGVTLGGQHTKNGEAATIPLPDWVAAEVAPWVVRQTVVLWPDTIKRQARGAAGVRAEARPSARGHSVPR